MGDAPEGFYKYGRANGMGVPADRIMRFIAYTLYIVGDRANPGGHDQGRLGTLLLGSPFVTKIYRASLRELAIIMIFFLDKMAFEYYYSNIRNTGA